MTTVHRQPDVVRGYRDPQTRRDTPEARATSEAERVGPPTAWRQRVPGPQLPGFVTGVTLLAGLWLLLAPAVLGYRDTGGGFDARSNDLLIGLVLTVVGLARLSGRVRLAAATAPALACGLWLIIAPFALAYGLGANSSAATANDMLLGLMIGVVTVVGHASARMTVATRI